MAINPTNRINTYRILSSIQASSEAASRSVEKITSDLRITRPSDDPAGVLTATRLKSKASIYRKAIDNINQSTSLFNVTKNALTALQDIVTKQQELAEKASSASISQTQRNAIHAEANALVTEFNRIVSDTEFHEIKPFVGAPSTVQTQVGPKMEDNYTLALPQGGTVTVSSTTTSEYRTGVVVGGSSGPGTNQERLIGVVDLNGDSNLDVVVASGDDGKAFVRLGNGDGTFKGDVSYAFGSGTSLSFLLDVTGDGKLDLVGAFDSGALIVARGNGDGTFKAQQTQSGALTGAAALNWGSGDYNGDGKQDLILGDTAANRVILFSGNGDGTFKRSEVANVGGNLGSVASADFDADGKLDFSYSIDGTTSVVTWYGNGNGTFKLGATVNGNVSGADPLVNQDLNGDGKIDIAYNGSGGDFTVILGNGGGGSSSGPAGTFSATVSYASGFGGQTDFITLIDLNLDGDADYVGSDGNDGTIRIALNNGDGTFRAPTSLNIGSGEGYDVYAGMFDSGSRQSPSLVVASPSNGWISIFHNNGNGTFNARTTLGLNGASQAEKIVGVKDVNGDRRDDIVVRSQDDKIYVLLGNGNSTFKAAVSYAYGVSVVENVAGLVDVTGDGVQDVVGITASSDLVVLRGNSDGTFKVAVTQGGSTEVIRLGTFADFNYDGYTDWIVGSRNSNQVHYYQSNGDGTFKRNVIVSSTQTASGVVSADFDKDGNLDFAYTSDQDGTSKIYVWSGNGNGTFAFSRSIGNAVNSPDPLASADLNGDGAIDLVYGGWPNPTIGVILGNSNTTGTPTGTFTPSDSIYSAHDYSSTVDLVDINGDLILDHIFTGANNTVAIRLGNGDGSFKAVRNQVINSSGGTWDSDIGDVNGDGKKDIVVTSDNSDSLIVLFGNGDGTFKAQMSQALVESWNSRIKLVDLNSDGKLDLLTPNDDIDALRWMAGNGNGTFKVATTIFSLPGQAFRETDPLVADFNGDGKLDVAMGAWGAMLVSLGNGNGTFTAQQTVGQWLAARGATVADFTGDGILDISIGPGLDRLTVLVGNGDGTFSIGTVISMQTMPGEPEVANFWAIKSGDFNGENKVDMVTLVQEPWYVDNKSLQVFLGNGNGTFAIGRNYLLKNGQADIAIGDINSDGGTDIVTMQDSGTGRIFLGDLDGNTAGGGGSSGTTFKAPVSSFNGLGAAADRIKFMAPHQNLLIW